MSAPDPAYLAAIVDSSEDAIIGKTKETLDLVGLATNDVLWDRDFRTGRTTRSHAIECYGYADDGGTISFHSEPGRGTTFRVQLPHVAWRRDGDERVLMALEVTA